MSWWQDLWRVGQWAGLSALLIALMLPVARKIGWVLMAILSIQVAYGLHILYFGYASMRGFNFQLSTVAAEAVFWLVAGAIAVSRIRPDDWVHLRPVIAWVGIANALIMIGTRLALGSVYGMVPSPAMNSALVACCLPAMSYRDSRFSVPMFWVMLAAIFVAGQSTGIAAALAVFAVILMGEFKGKKLPRKVVLLSWAACFGFLALMAWVLMPKGDFSISELLSSRGRTETWRLMLEQIGSGFDTRQVLGSGLGTFEWLHPIYQAQHTTPSQYFLWAHNEFLQVLYENGVLGLGALLVLVVRVVHGAWKSPELLATAAAYGIAMMTQPPLRVAPFQILGVVLLAMTLKPLPPWDPFASMRPEAHD